MMYVMPKGRDADAAVFKGSGSCIGRMNTGSAQLSDEIGVRT